MKKHQNHSDKHPYFISLQNDYAFVQCMKNPKVLQMLRYEYWDSRSLFYTSKLFVESLEKGQDYDELKKVISISILGFDYCKETDYFYSSFHIREDKKKFLYSEMLEFHIIELVKLECEIQDDDAEIYKWTKLIAAKSKEERMILEKDPYVEEALREIERLSNDPEKRDEHELRNKALRDYVSFTNAARKEGLTEGHKEGLEKGLAEGLEKGFEKGTKKNVLTMLKNGLDEQNISQITEISITQIQKWATE